MQFSRGLYVITDPALSDDLIKDVEQSLLGGASVVQYRNKLHDRQAIVGEVNALLELCRGYQVPLLINDDVELAAETGADGVHLGRDDSGLEAARERLGHEAIIGISCYNEIERALEMQRRGASYVAFGRFFPSRTKPQAVQADIELLQHAAEQLTLPIVAIGGITAQNGATLIEAGADLLAVIHGVFGQDDVRKASESFSVLFSE